MKKDQTSSALVLVLLWSILGPTTLILVLGSGATDLPGFARMMSDIAAAVSFVGLAATTTVFWRVDPMGLATCVALILVPAGGLTWGVVLILIKRPFELPFEVGAA